MPKSILDQAFPKLNKEFEMNLKAPKNNWDKNYEDFDDNKFKTEKRSFTRRFIKEQSNFKVLKLKFIFLLYFEFN